MDLVAKENYWANGWCRQVEQHQNQQEQESVKNYARHTRANRRKSGMAAVNSMKNLMSANFWLTRS